MDLTAWIESIRSVAEFLAGFGLVTVDRLAAEFTRKRTINAVIAATFGLLCGVAIVYSQPMFAFNSLMVALIFAIRSFDAHTMIQDVRRRSRKTLFVRIPFIDHEESAATSNDVG